MTEFAPHLPFHLLQAVRLTHALMESDADVRVPPEHADKFSALRREFDASYEAAGVGTPVLCRFRIDHQTPRTSVGNLERPLIFPHAIIERCRSYWPAQRDLRVTFAGLITPERKGVLDAWLAREYPGVSVPLTAQQPPSLLARLFRRAPRERIPKEVQVAHGEVTIWSSDAGRRFPDKSWDDGYYRTLARSEFVLCPSGDFTWSYRFFESLLCGAVPIVQEPCAAYEGFEFLVMGEPLGTDAWTPERAEHNFRLASERLSLPLGALNSELAGLLDGQPSHAPARPRPATTSTAESAS